MPVELQYATSFVFGYLCGSIPFGMLLTRLAGAPDLRSVGSGNIGATNVLRTGRKGLAAATLIGDMLKGTVAVLLTAYFFGQRLRARRGDRRFSRPSVSGLAALSRRQGGGDLYRPSARPGLARGPCVLRHLARGGGADPLLVAGGADRQRSNAAPSCGGTRCASGAGVRAALGAALDHAPRQYRAAYCAGKEGKIGSPNEPPT